MSYLRNLSSIVLPNLASHLQIWLMNLYPDVRLLVCASQVVILSLNTLALRVKQNGSVSVLIYTAVKASKKPFPFRLREYLSPSPGHF